MRRLGRARLRVEISHGGRDAMFSIVGKRHGKVAVPIIRVLVDDIVKTEFAERGLGCMRYLGPAVVWDAVNRDRAA